MSQLPQMPQATIYPKLAGDGSALVMENTEDATTSGATEVEKTENPDRAAGLTNEVHHSRRESGKATELGVPQDWVEILQQTIKNGMRVGLDINTHFYVDANTHEPILMVFVHGVRQCPRCHNWHLGQECHKHGEPSDAT